MVYMQERLNSWSVSSSLYAVKAHGKALKIAAERGIDNNIDDASVVNTHSDTDRPRQAWERICNMDLDAATSLLLSFPFVRSFLVMRLV